MNISHLRVTADDPVTVSTRPTKGRTTELMAKLPHFTLGCVTDRWCTTMEKMIVEHGQLLSDFEIVTIVTNKLPTEIRKELEMQTVDTPTELFTLLRRYYPADTVQKDVRLRSMQQGLDETGKQFLDKVLAVFKDTSCPLPVGIDQLEALVVGFRPEYAERLHNELKHAKNSDVIPTMQVLKKAVEEADRAATAKAHQARLVQQRAHP